MDKDTVVRYHMEDEFNQLKKIDEFVVRVWKGELDILKSWEAYFKSLNIPYAVTKVKYRRRYAWYLWKENLIEENADKRYYESNKETKHRQSRERYKRKNPNQGDIN